MRESFDRQGSDSRWRAGSRAAVLWLIAVLALAGSWSAPAVAQEAAYTVAGTDLYRLDFATGKLTPLGDLGVAGIDALAIDPSGVLYGLSLDNLYTIDPGTPAATLVGPTGLFPSDQPYSMTFDADGRLWLTARGILHEVDPATGDATVIGTDQGLLALAADGVDLFGIISGLPPPPDPETPSGDLPPLAVLVDKTIGVVQVLAPLEGLVVEDPFGVDDMVFDGQGHAWILAIDDPPVTPPQVTHWIYRAVELETGVVELISERSEPGVSILLGAMALIPNRGIVDIPTLGWGGFSVLVVALAGCALGILRRIL